MLNAGITPGGARVRLARRQRRPCAARPLRACADRRGPARRSDGAVRPAATALAEAGIEPLALGPKEGLALINGTDGMLGMLVLALADLVAWHGSPTSRAAMSVEALLGTDRVFAEELHRAAAPARAGAERGEPADAAGGLGDRGQPPGRRPARPGRLLAALRPAGRRRGPRHDRLAEAVADAELALGDRQPDGAPRRPRRVLWQLPRRSGRPSRCDFLAIAAADVGAIAERRTDRMLDHSRSHGLPAFLADDAGRQLGPDDRPVHAGGDGRREPPARSAGERRLAPHQRDAGGPRVDGLGRRAQAAHVR